MATLSRLVSSVLLVAGVGMVLLGFSTALGLTIGGILASLAAIAALMYVGAVWFGGPPVPPARPAPMPVSVIVFDGAGRIVTGPETGHSVASLFPEKIRPEIERRTAAALAGTPARFPCLYDGRTVLLDALPVRGADGTILYGILLTAGSAAIAATA
jgi:hypothetical protein